ncbi:MAG: FtsW/RodA/SpoVE family cell cycle protein [Planctomycetes bacterium]|nr:FtsW/RodA/SpoVE family cell cycle protein [Planctomycetota bacterium]
MKIIAREGAARTSGTLLLASAILLTLMGVLHILSAMLPRAFMGESDAVLLIVKQVTFVVAAAVVCLFTSRIDYHRLVDAAPRILLVVWVALLVVLALPAVNGARRWLNVGPFGLQASELAKLAVVLGAAWYVDRRSAVIKSYFKGFLPAALGLGVTVGLVAAEPDFGTSLFLIATAGILLFLGGVSIRHILITGLAALPLFVAVMIDKFRHVMDRLSSFRDGPHEQVERAIEAMGAGGVMGVGLGQTRSSLWFVPYVETDFVYAAVGEQFGLLGTLSVLALFLVFLWHGLRIAVLAPDQRGFLVAFGLTFVVVFQALINMTVVTGLVPPKGIGLPFVSYGGSSLIVLGMLVGVLLSVARVGRQEEPELTLSIATLAPGASKEGD